MKLLKNLFVKTPDIDLVKEGGIKKHTFVDERKVISREVPPEMFYQTTGPAGVRWMLQTPFRDGLLYSWVRAERPSMTMDIEHTVFGFREHTHMGRQRWGDIYMEFYGSDDWDMLREWVQHSTDGRQGSKKNLSLQLLDPTGVVIEDWHLIGAFPTELRLHDDFDTTMMGMNLSIDHAVLRT
jgi:hypothetical protein